MILDQMIERLERLRVSHGGDVIVTTNMGTEVVAVQATPHGKDETGRGGFLELRLVDEQEDEFVNRGGVFRTPPP